MAGPNRPAAKRGSPQMSVGRGGAIGGSARGAGGAGGFGMTGHGVHLTDPRAWGAVAGVGRRGVAAGPAGVSTRYARPPRCCGPAGDTPAVPPLKRQIWALRPGPDGGVPAVHDNGEGATAGGWEDGRRLIVPTATSGLAPAVDTRWRLGRGRPQRGDVGGLLQAVGTGRVARGSSW